MKKLWKFICWNDTDLAFILFLSCAVLFIIGCTTFLFFESYKILIFTGVFTVIYIILALIYQIIKTIKRLQ